MINSITRTVFNNSYYGTVIILLMTFLLISGCSKKDNTNPASSNNSASSKISLKLMVGIITIRILVLMEPVPRERHILAIKMLLSEQSAEKAGTKIYQ